MSHNVFVACLLLGLCSLYWLSVVAIVSGHRALQHLLRRVAPWLAAGIILALYIPAFRQYGVSPFPLVMFCFFLGTSVLLGLIQMFVSMPLPSKPSWSVLLLGALSTVGTGLLLRDIYAWEVLKSHPTYSVPADYVLMPLWLLLLPWYSMPLKRLRSSRFWNDDRNVFRRKG